MPSEMWETPPEFDHQGKALAIFAVKWPLTQFREEISDGQLHSPELASR